MKIKYKGIIHERSEDATFIGALIIANSCNIKCKNCFNRHLKKLPTLTNTAEDIIKQVKLNLFNEGIILGGLEFSERPLELLELCKEASKANLKIMIYTGHDLDKFYYKIGKACVNQTDFKLDLPPIMGGASDELYCWIGSYMLSHYIPTDYYIKSGRYDKDNLTDINKPFGVTLASANQKICLIKGVRSNENDFKS